MEGHLGHRACDIADPGWRPSAAGVHPGARSDPLTFVERKVPPFTVRSKQLCDF